MSDVPVSALYYPHTAIQSVNLLKSALLLWDHVECIVPRRRVSTPRVDAEVAAATELVVQPHVPSDDSRRRVHERLSEIFKDGVPAWLRSDVAVHRLDRSYLMYPDKLADETWRLLERFDLAASNQHDYDYAVPASVGLLALAILADECAGTTRTRVTDRQRAYARLFGAMTTEMGGEYLPTIDASHLADSYDRLLTASIRIIDTDGIPLSRLIEVRRRHESALRPLRKKYLQVVTSQVQALTVPGTSASDKDEIVRRFEADMRDDFADLKRELGYAAKDVLFSKEVGICALAVAGAVIAPATLPAAAATLSSLGVGALVGTHAKYRKAREKAFKDHAMSWLYQAVQ